MAIRLVKGVARELYVYLVNQGGPAYLVNYLFDRAWTQRQEMAIRLATVKGVQPQ